MSILSISLIIIVAGLLLALICLNRQKLQDTTSMLLLGLCLLSAALASVAFIFYPNTDFAQVMGVILAASMLLAGSFVGGTFSGS